METPYLGIDSYGTSMPTLEEVFLRLGDEENEEEGGDPKVVQQVSTVLGVRTQIVKSNYVLRERRVDISDV